MLPLKDLERLYGEPDSAIAKCREEVHVALHPRFTHDLRVGLLSYFNSQINKWHPKLNGILAGYGKLQVKSPMGAMINEEPYQHLDVVSDFWVFRPDVGKELRGVVTKKSPTHISCLVHGIFNVPCHKPADQKGAFASNVKIDSQVRLQVIKTDMSQPVPYILGTYLGIVGAKEKAQAIDSPIEMIEPGHWEQAVTSGVVPSSPATPAAKRKRSPVKKAAAPLTNGLPAAPAAAVQAAPVMEVPAPVVTTTPKGRKKASKAEQVPVPQAVMNLIQSPVQAAVTQQLPQQPAAPTPPAKGKRKPAAKKAAPVAPPQQAVVTQAVAMPQQLTQPPPQPVPFNINGLLNSLSPVKPSKKATKKATPMPEMIAAVVGSLPPPVPAAAPAVVAPAVVPAAAVPELPSPSKKSKKSKKVKEEDVTTPVRTGVNPHLAQTPMGATGLNGNGPLNSTEMQTPDGGTGVTKKSKKKKRHISEVGDDLPATPIMKAAPQEAAEAEAEVTEADEAPPKKKKKKKDKKREEQDSGNAGHEVTMGLDETAVAEKEGSSKKHKKKKKKSSKE